MEVPNARASASGLSVVFTLLVAHKGIATACKRYTLFFPPKKKARPTLMSVNVKKTATTPQTVAILKKSLVFAECRTTSSLSPGRRAPNLRRATQMDGLVAIELVLEDEVCGELGQILDIVVDKISWPPRNLLSDSWVRLVLNCNPSVFASCSFGRRSSVGMVLGRDFVQSCTVLFSPPDVHL